jgi:hypothetical protein
MRKRRSRQLKKAFPISLKISAAPMLFFLLQHRHGFSNPNQMIGIFSVQVKQKVINFRFICTALPENLCL